MKFWTIISLVFVLTNTLAQQDASDATVNETIQKEYQKVLDKAENFFEAKEYENALNLYKRALTLKPTDEAVKIKIEEIKRLMDPICYGNTAYEKVICKADGYFASENYSGAIQFYQRAAMLNPGEAYPAKMIEKINGLLKADNF
jgi:tetratricopeptide (TPR) repeat protein